MHSWCGSQRWIKRTLLTRYGQGAMTRLSQNSRSNENNTNNGTGEAFESPFNNSCHNKWFEDGTIQAGQICFPTGTLSCNVQVILTWGLKEMRRWVFLQIVNHQLGYWQTHKWHRDWIVEKNLKYWHTETDWLLTGFHGTQESLEMKKCQHEKCIREQTRKICFSKIGISSEQLECYSLDIIHFQWTWTK